MRLGKQTRRDPSQVWMELIIALAAGVGAYWGSEMTYSLVEGTWNGDNPRLGTHMWSYLLAWLSVGAVVFVLGKFSTGSKRVALLSCFPWLVNAVFAGAAIVFRVDGHIIVLLTSIVAVSALYRMRVLEGPQCGLNLAKRRRLSRRTMEGRKMSQMGTNRNEQRGSEKRPFKPNNKH